ncbi:MAG: methylated-DNA--[protein]-cysteine S-methyltransferase, partial [Armatimonadetes bacterium]|nr:methylated-DNA--[protein]-cysteine S-methyltransferase [Armatimonadota bacterium]
MTGLGRRQVPVAGERWFQLPLGWCHLQASEGGLVRVELPASGPGPLGPDRSVRDDNALAKAILETAESELRAYFAGDLEVFTVPVDLTGITPFRQSVLRACQNIPCGQTMTYGELGERAGYPGSARAVGQAMARNPLPFVIPCHRVVGCGGRLT